MIIGAQLYTVRDYCRNESDIRKTLKAIADIGYTTVQVSGIAAIDPHVLREICDELGLKIIITHVSAKRIMQETEAIINEHSILGCTNIGIGALPGEYGRNREGIMSFIEDIKAPAHVISQSGMTFNYHNHSFEFEKDVSGKTLFDIMIEETDPDDFYFILDTYWVQHGGANPTDYIYKLKGRINVAHFKDMAIREWKQKFASVGSGNLNWDSILKACTDTGVEYAMIEQDSDFIDDPLNELKRSYDYLAFNKKIILT